MDKYSYFETAETYLRNSFIILYRFRASSSEMYDRTTKHPPLRGASRSLLKMATSIGAMHLPFSNACVILTKSIPSPLTNFKCDTLLLNNFPVNTISLCTGSIVASVTYPSRPGKSWFKDCSDCKICPSVKGIYVKRLSFIHDLATSSGKSFQNVFFRSVTRKWNTPCTSIVSSSCGVCGYVYWGARSDLCTW
jgi:hypothetical protein